MFLFYMNVSFGHLFTKDQFLLSECYILSSILGTEDMVKYKKAKIFVLKKQRGNNERK